MTKIKTKKYNTLKRRKERRKRIALAFFASLFMAVIGHYHQLNFFTTDYALAEVTTPKSEKKTSWTVEEVKQIVEVVAIEEGIARDLMHYVAEYESGYVWDKENPRDPRGGAIGTFQIILGWHPSIDASCARDPWCSARYFAKRTKEGYCESLWTTCRNYYNQ